jgi:predicted MFS family arabinose efflux permease
MDRSLLALCALNFFMADVRDGLGPFLGVFLQEQSWSPAEIGFVMTIGGLVGMVAVTPAGMLVDKTTAKRAILVAAMVAVIAASLVILFLPSFIATSAAQSINAIAAAMMAPAVAAVTLGLVKQQGYAHQLGRNEAFNHAGNVTAALLAGFFGYLFGLGAVFAVMAGMAVGAMAAVAAIDPDRIDHKAARGLGSAPGDQGASFSVLVTSGPLLVLGLTLLLFHLGNAAMLPLLGQALVARGAGDPSVFTSATIIIAQLTMIATALYAARLAEQRGYWLVFLIALLSLPVRGLIASLITDPIGLAPVQVLDGIGAGMLGAAVPGLVARILAGTGHVNAGLGAAMTMQGIGASLSATVGGLAAEHLGYAAAFLVLAGIAVLALALWVVARPITGGACGDAPAAAQPSQLRP